MEQETSEDASSIHAPIAHQKIPIHPYAKTKKHCELPVHIVSLVFPGVLSNRNVKMVASYPSGHKHARKGRHAACKKCDGVVQDSAHRWQQRLRNRGGDFTQPRTRAPCLTCKACETALGCQLASCYEAIRSKEGSQFATYDGGRGGQKDGPTLP